jgi:pimeloyl-ACP methyl ester carboxylesterase
VRDFAHAARVRTDAVLGSHDALAFRDGTAAPVVMLPGVYETWHFMKPLAVELFALGHPVHLLTELGANRRPIPETAASVARYLEREGLEHAVLVGHSKGGLVGKHLMVFDDAESRVDRLIAVASPFHGSAYARLMPQPALRTFRAGHPTVRLLRDTVDVNARITSIYPEFDPHIPEGSELEGALNIEVPVRGHFRVLVEPWALRTVVDAVEGRHIRMRESR